jgi:hypothetical protein
VQLQAGVGAVDASWLNQVELRFSKLKRDLLGCGNSPPLCYKNDYSGTAWRAVESSRFRA